MDSQEFVPPEPRITEEMAKEIAIGFLGDERYKIVWCKFSSAKEYFEEVGTKFGGTYMIRFSLKSDDRTIPGERAVLVNDQTGEPKFFESL